MTFIACTVHWLDESLLVVSVKWMDLYLLIFNVIFIRGMDLIRLKYE